MGSVPDFLLRHTVTVEPYRDWGDFADGRTLRCFVGERLASAGDTGTERIAQITIVCHLGENVPAGSRITLADGRQGYAAAVVNHDGGGLPTPDHMEIAMRIAGAYGPAFGEPVTILTRTTARDNAGATTYAWTRRTIIAAVRMLTSNEAAVGRAETAVDTVEVVLPPGTPVDTRDRMEVRGLLYDVDGVPVEVTDPQTTARPGVKVIGKRRAS